MKQNSETNNKQLEQQKESRLKCKKVTFKQSLMGACTNLMYKLGGFKQIPLLLKSDPATNTCVIFGEQILDKMVAQSRVSNIVWFTYRQKLKIAQDINSDVGWGCLPRVGQMVLAQALLKNFVEKGFSVNQKLILKIIKPFLDESQQVSNYSLSTILKYARWKFAISPGDWFNIGQLGEVLRKIQDQIPLQGSQNLKIAFFNQSVIFLDSISEKANIKKCRCSKGPNFLCEICNKGQQDKKTKKDLKIREESEQIVLTIEQYSQKQKSDHQADNDLNLNNWEIYDKTPQKYLVVDSQNSHQTDQDQNHISAKNLKITETQLQNNLLLIVSVRISQKTIQKFDQDAIFELLAIPSSIGIIGGVPSKALFIVGFEGKDLKYLDPHYVQQHVDKNNYENYLNTFFCSEFRTLRIDNLDPSMAFCFYLKTIQQIKLLVLKIQQLKQTYQKNNRSFFISVMERNIYNDDQYSDSKLQQNEKHISFQHSSLQFRDITDSL